MRLKPVKQSYFSTYFLLPMIVLLGIIALALWVMPASGSMLDCIDSTCRVTPGDGGSGTGSVFLIEDGQVFVLTNAHVATTIRMGLGFWDDGHLSKKIFGSTVLRSVSRDVAVIAVEASVFGRFLPTAIPLAPLGTRLHQGQAVMSVGCPGGQWATAWRGHVHGQPSDGRVAFNPAPALGRSGSAIYDTEGKHIVALLFAQELSGPGGEPINGLAIDIENIYAAIYGKMVRTKYTVLDREIFWPSAKQSQCGPQGCPTPQNQGGGGWRGEQGGIGGYGYILPYRKRQQERDRQQDKKIGDLYPTKPFTPPKAEVGPPPRYSFPTPKSKPPVVKKERMSPVLALVVLFVMCMAGVAIGLISQWKATYRKL